MCFCVSNVLKHYAVIVFVEELQKFTLSNYECFSCRHASYTNFLNKFMKVVNKIVPSKEIRNKNNNEWFNREIAESIHTRN